MKPTTRSGGSRPWRRTGFGLLSAALAATSAAVIAAPPAQAATTTLVVDTLDHAVGDWAVPGQRTLYAAIEAANALPESMGDDVRITFDDALTGNITVDTGAEIAIRQSNDNIGALGDTVDYLGNGAFYRVAAQQPVTIDFGGDVGFEHTFDQNYAAILVDSDDVTVENFTQMRAGASGVVIGNGVSGATVRNGSMVEPGVNLETGVGILPGVSNLTITDVTMQNVFRFGIMFDRTPDADTDPSTIVSGVTIDGLDASETEQFGDIWYLPDAVASDVTVTGSTFNSPRATNVHFHNGTEVTDMTVSSSTFVGGNPRASITAFGNSVTNGLEIIDNEFQGAWVFEDYAGSGSHTGLTFTGNLVEEARLYALDFNQSDYTDTLVEDNDFINAFGSGDPTIWLGINSGSVSSGGNNVVRANRFIQEADYVAENGVSATNRYAVLNDSRATTATDPTGWSITENYIEGYQGTTRAPISNTDRGTTEIWGNTFGPNTTGSLDRADTEVGSRWFVWNANGLNNNKIQTWRVSSSTYGTDGAGDPTVTIAAESVEPLRGNNAETQPVSLHAYWTADDNAEIYLGEFTGGPFTATATDTFTSTEINGDGTVRVQTIDADGNSSQYSGEGDAEPDLSFACPTGTVFISQNNPTQLFTAVQSDGGVTFEPEGPPSGVQYNGLGFNEEDGFLYALQQNGNLLRIGEGGAIENLGPVAGLPASSYNHGVFGQGADAGTYYVKNFNAGAPIVAIDIEARTASVVTTASPVPNLSDFVYLEGFLWGQTNNVMWRINPATGAVRQFNTGLGISGDFGGQWTYGNGDIGLSRNAPGTVFRIRVNDPTSDNPTFTRVFTTTGPASDLNDAAACIGDDADVEIEKTGPASYVDGDVITYTLTVTNNGPGDSSGSMVTDQIPSGLSAAGTTTPGCQIAGGELNCIFGSLPAGSSQEIELTGTASGAGEPLTNVATVVGNDPDPDVDNNTATTTAESNVAGPVPAPDTCGTDFVETFGAGTGYGAQLPPGTTTYLYQGATPVGPDGSTSDGEYSILSDATIAGSYYHSGSDNTGDPNGQFMVVNADLSPGVFYQRDVTGLVPGESYLLSAAIANANNNNSPQLPNVTLRIVDPSDDSVVDSLSTGSIANTPSLVWTEYGLVFEVPAGLTEARLEVANNGPGGEGNDLAIDDVTLGLACPELEVVKSADLADTNSNGVGDEGEVITYSFVVTNTGNLTITDVSVADPLTGLSAITPATVTSLAVGASATFTATYTITEADGVAGEVVNQATASGSDPAGGAVSDESNEVTVFVAPGTVPAPELDVVKSADLADTNSNGVGDEDEVITYSFEVTNTGNVAIDDVSVTDPLTGLSAITPATVATLAVGASATFTATYTITAADGVAGEVVNQATTSGSDPMGGAVSDESNEVTVLVAPGTVPAPELEVVKSADLDDTNTNGLGDEGEVITYSFEVTNTGNVAITDVSVADPLAGLSAITPATVATLAVGASATFTATYTVTAADEVAGEVVNQATVSGSGPAGGAVSDTSNEVVVPTDPPAPVVEIDKAGALTVDRGRSGRADEGDVITYTFTVRNTGATPANEVRVLDNLRGLSRIRPAQVPVLSAGDSATFTATYEVTRRDVRRGGVENVARAQYRAPGVNNPVVSPSSNLVAVPAAVRRPKSQPRITTTASAKKVRVPVLGNGSTGSVKLFDRVRIRNFTAGGNATGRATLYGPTSTRSTQVCRPANAVRTVRFDPRNGRLRTPAITVSEPGYYTWVVRTTADRFNRAASHRCGLPRETTLVHRPGYAAPVIDTGVGAPALSARAAMVDRISRVSVPALGLSAPVDVVGRDGRAMVIPGDVNRAGWLRSSAGLGEKVGSTVIAGHVSDNSDRPGQFGKLRAAKRGQLVTVMGASGKMQQYRISRVFSQPRTKTLPKGLFSTTKKHRLVLVTCTGKITYPNGRFHYTRNQVVVAKPVR